MKYSSTAKRGLVVLSYFAFLMFGMFFCVSQSLAANPPFQNVSTAVVPVGSQQQLNFSINDPARGVVAGNSGPRNLTSTHVRQGVVWCTYTNNGSKFVLFSVYDPKYGNWRYASSEGVDANITSPDAYSNGGTVWWWGGNNKIRFAAYDSDLGSWVIGSADQNFNRQTSDDPTGAVGWRAPDGGLALAIYYPYPGAKQWLIGTTGPLAIPVTWGFNNAGTIDYRANGVNGKLGLGYTGGGNPIFYNGNTVARAYHIPSKTGGNVPLTVSFWDMSIGSTSWLYQFNDGTGATSTSPSPTYTFNTAVNAPFLVEQNVSGPGGSHQWGVGIAVTTSNSISGTVTNANGFKIPNATVTLTGTISRTTQTDSNGNYSFANLTANGFYIVTVTKARTTFTPATRTFSNLNGAQTGNFVGKLNDKPSDFDGDGKTDPSVFRPGTTEWWISNSSNNSVGTATYGFATDKITPRDFDGDGRTDIAVWRPSEGTWYILNSATLTTSIVNFGASGDIPVANDYDGDDKADPAVFRPSTATWYILRSSNSQASQVQFGLGTDKPVIGDYDGDEKGDFAVFRESELVWQIRRSSDAQTVLQTWGYSTDNLAPGDYDGDGKHDVAVFRSSMGTWYALLSSNQTWFTPSFGTSGDYPTQQSYLPE